MLATSSKVRWMPHLLTSPGFPHFDKATHRINITQRHISPNRITNSQSREKLFETWIMGFCLGLCLLLTITKLACFPGCLGKSANVKVTVPYRSTRLQTAIKDVYSLLIITLSPKSHCMRIFTVKSTSQIDELMSSLCFLFLILQNIIWNGTQTMLLSRSDGPPRATWVLLFWFSPVSPLSQPWRLFTEALASGEGVARTEAPPRGCGLTCTWSPCPLLLISLPLRPVAFKEDVWRQLTSDYYSKPEIGKEKRIRGTLSPASVTVCVSVCMFA